MARVTVVTTGGTIASRTDPATGAATAAVTAEELLAEVPALSRVAAIHGHQFRLVNSWDVTPALVVELAGQLRRLAAQDPPDGFVVTHGTDTMEETAFALALQWDLDIPVVLTGAMRAADAPGADGPRNLLEAVRVAADPTARGLGVVVAMGGYVHAARHVVKTHTTALDTFASPEAGPLGTIDDAGTRWHAPPPRVPTIEVAHPLSGGEVDLVTMVSGLGPRPFEAALDAGVAGVVLAGSGSGNLHGDAVPALGALLDAQVPVVLASRCLAGRVVPSYGGTGGGASLVALGVVPAGDLAAVKARLALRLLVGAGAGTEQVRAWFEAASAARAADG